MNMLDQILNRKRKEVALLLEKSALKRSFEKKKKKRFSESLKESDFAIIAEIKRKSPSAGTLSAIQDPLHLAKEYEKGGASAISILTDKEGFGGTLEDLNKVANGVSLPTLRKDFLIHPIQFRESLEKGADAVLLIVTAVQKDLKMLFQEATNLGLEALVEVHTLEELELALKIEAPLIAVNHRNLKTFEVDLSISEKLLPYFPKTTLKVAASGIHTSEQAKRLKEIGYQALLVGEALVSCSSPSTLIQEMKTGKKSC